MEDAAVSESNILYSAVDCSAIVTLMNRKYAAWIGERYFKADIRYESNAVHVTITLRDEAGTAVYPVEGRILTTAQNIGAQEGAEILIDFIDTYFEDHFKSGGDSLLPIDWSEYSFEEKTLQVRGQICNEKLERLADALLSGEKQAWS